MQTPASAPSILRVPPDRLRAPVDEALLPESTANVAPLEAIAGQARAREALEFGLRITAEGYHVAVAGPHGSGRNSAARLVADALAASRPPAADWVYIHNFADPRTPRAVRLPNGQGGHLVEHLTGLVESCRDALPRAFDTESYEARARQALEPFEARRDATLKELDRFAQARGFLVSATPGGLLAFPRARDGSPMAPEVYRNLPADVRAKLEAESDNVNETIAATVRDVRRIDAEAAQALRDLDRDVTRYVVGPILDDLRQEFVECGLAPYFDAVEADIVANLSIFKQFTSALPQSLPPQLFAQLLEQREEILRRYRANLFVSHPAGHRGAPVVDERSPNYRNLVGRISFENRQGALVTDFTQVRGGALHAANGGFLVLQAQDLLADPRAWAALKQSLKNREVRIEDWAEGLGVLPVAGISPEPVPLDVKVILIGEPLLLAVLDAVDSDFPSLFKVRAEFEPDVELSPSAIADYTGFVRRTVDASKLLPFRRSALAELIQYGARLAGRQDRLSSRFAVIADLCHEANHIAALEGVEAVEGAHVLRAITARRNRSSLLADRLRRLVADGTLHIQTTGTVVGQVNGLAVYSTGAHEFGTPLRISCRVGVGQQGVIDVERESERSGAIHTKGVLVLSGYLMGLFGRTAPLAFTASLTFEQSYDEVEGDSASVAELCAILTAIADCPARQDTAITGSVDQFGNVQAVGGVTEKVEGFFDVCSEAGLTGAQGVIMPASNVRDLTLRPDVAEAITAGRFHLWPVTRVEQALTILTGEAAGELDQFGNFPPHSLLGRVATRLGQMSDAAVPAMLRTNHHTP
ncbi:MAG: AAA family ATPase [Dehalococcoidia bacterium]|nr:AAA family ATPase [Dehalococcoidia bacterium]